MLDYPADHEDSHKSFEFDGNPYLFQFEYSDKRLNQMEEEWRRIEWKGPKHSIGLPQETGLLLNNGEKVCCKVGPVEPTARNLVIMFAHYLHEYFGIPHLNKDMFLQIQFDECWSRGMSRLCAAWKALGKCRIHPGSSPPTLCHFYKQQSVLNKWMKLFLPPIPLLIIANIWLLVSSSITWKFEPNPPITFWLILLKER